MVADRGDKRTAMGPSELAATIANDFYKGRLDLSARGVEHAGWSDMPEVKAVSGLADGVDGQGSQSRRTVRRFLTFTSAMDRARDAGKLWCRARKLLDSDGCLFDPAKVSRMSSDNLRERLDSAHVSQRHDQDSSAWKTIARSLDTGEGAVAHLVEHGTGDAVELLKDLGSTDGDGRSRYPLLRGPKLGPMWVRIMAAPGGAKVKHIEAVPVAVDVHVRKVTENLRVADTAGLLPDMAKPIIQCAWKNAVAEADFDGPAQIASASTCAALDPALWYFGKHGCSYCKKMRRRECISQACRACQYTPEHPIHPVTHSCTPTEKENENG